MKSLKIGNIKLKNRLFLAPMVDVTDVAYRILCREQGAAMTYTEMINIGAILHENEKTLRMLKTFSKDKPVGLQVTGKNVKEFEELIKRKEILDFDLIDINCGCPSLRITGNESGSYLLKNPEKIGKMIKVLKKTGKPVTAKIRLGFRKNEVLKISKEIEKAGADLITIHARTSVQRNREPAEWNWIRKVKNEIGIPVVGNGGVINGKTASEMLEIADGVMIATAAIGNPFIFRETLRYLKSGKEKEIGKTERVKAFGDYIKLSEKHDVVDLSRIKFLGGWFLKGFSGVSEKRKELMDLKTLKNVKSFVKKL